MEPITREEFYLAAAAGEDVPVPEPITRRDMYMKAMIDKGGGSGSTPDWNAAEGEPGHVLNRTHYTEPLKFDIRWDGDRTDRFALDVSQLGYPEGTYYVKVSDEVLTTEEVVGGKMYSTQDDEGVFAIIHEDNIDTSTFPGAFIIYSDTVVCYAQAELNAALGLPDGYITNGTYFFSRITDSFHQHTTRLVGPETVHPLDKKYIPYIPAPHITTAITVTVDGGLKQDRNAFGELTKEEQDRFVNGLVRGVVAVDFRFSALNYESDDYTRIHFTLAQSKKEDALYRYSSVQLFELNGELVSVHLELSVPFDNGDWSASSVGLTVKSLTTTQ